MSATAAATKPTPAAIAKMVRRVHEDKQMRQHMTQKLGDIVPVKDKRVR